MEGKDSGRGDFRDLGDDKEPQILLDHYDESFLAIGKEMENLEEEGSFGRIKDILQSLLQTKPLKDCLTDELKEYFEHDAQGYRRWVMDISEHFLQDIDNHLKGGELDLDELKEQWGLVSKNWEAYRLVMEDLFLRMGAKDGEFVNGEQTGKDKEKDLDRLMNALEDLRKGCEKKGFNFSFEPDPLPEELEKIKLSIPHGSIFNLLQNCVSNATYHKIKAKKLKLKIDLKSDMMVFSLSDNGVGMEDEFKNTIFQKGVSGRDSRKQGTGLGLADADKRFAQMGGSVEVDSQFNLDLDKEWATTFVLEVPIVKK